MSGQMNSDAESKENTDAARPFQVVVQNPKPPAELTIYEEDDSLSLEEIEAAYLRAMEAAELVESQSLESVAEASETALALHAVGAQEEIEQELEPESAEHTRSIEPRMFDATETEDGTDEEIVVEEEEPPPISAEQVLEAVLFVGGGPLPTKKLLDVLSGSTTSEQLDQMLTDLNAKYLGEGRPYEIRLLTGGYVMQLRDEFDSVRSRSFGQGPKEVKLAQDALEVLALVAYKQPISREAMEEAEKPNLGPLLRQLLRRQLIALERRENDETAMYRTTPRFLGLFGLHSLDDLPQAGDFNFK
ncbi:SMC-Scp complex subunit ScpB [Planctomicrobium piriforme]|uniref:Segregation and condensation protein B n=1 Tax=Planctomicrobium piriforme TaxID=1576369 RepID=A0A1I3HCM2_9PLAN|nr:SMC-Scp complex subunit ScpB [Planctomicrobium piriforme]SFI33383.1 segregation and condensation protein B [Planctomicrobium piriforme]